MTNKLKLSLGILLLAFLLIPGFIHYIKTHEQMRLALAKDQRTIATLKAHNSSGETAPRLINLPRFCLPSNI